MIQVYVNLIRLGLKTIDDVPDRFKQGVIDALGG